MEREARRRLFRWVSGVGLAIFVAYLIFILASLASCDRMVPVP